MQRKLTPQEVKELLDRSGFSSISANDIAKYIQKGTYFPIIMNDKVCCVIKKTDQLQARNRKRKKPIIVDEFTFKKLENGIFEMDAHTSSASDGLTLHLDDCDCCSEHPLPDGFSIQWAGISSFEGDDAIDHTAKKIQEVIEQCTCTKECKQPTHCCGHCGCKFCYGQEEKRLARLGR